MTTRIDAAAPSSASMPPDQADTSLQDVAARYLALALRNGLTKEEQSLGAVLKKLPADSPLAREFEILSGLVQGDARGLSALEGGLLGDLVSLAKD